jgi:signal transduction histidine kinase
VLANAVETLLSGVRAREMSSLAVALLALAFVILTCVSLRPLPLVAGVIVVLALVAGAALASLFLFASVQLQVPATPFMLGGAAAYLVVVLEKRTAAEERRREEERRNALLRDLSAMITHDLKGPLTGIMGFVDLLSREQLDEQEREYVEVIGGCSRWLSVLVAAILDVAKIEAGQMTLNCEPLEARRELEQALTAVDYQLREKGIRTELAVSPDLPRVRADAEMFHRIVANLVGNAAKFAPDGSQVLLQAKLEASGDAVTVSVQDEGPGIPLEHQDRIFDKFVQVAKGRSAERISVGLGLAFCRLAVEAHGGRIWVQSEPGHGARFSFSLPLWR